MHCVRSCGSQLLTQETLGHFKTVLLKSHGLDRSLRIAMPHHQPPTTRSQGRDETGGTEQRGFAKAVSQSWINMDNLLISDVLSFERTLECQEVCLLKYWILYLACCNLKSDGLIPSRWMLTLFKWSSCYVRHHINKCLFFGPPLPLSLPIFLCVLDVEPLCSVTLLSSKHSLILLLAAWLETVPASTYFISTKAVFTS